MSCQTKQASLRSNTLLRSTTTPTLDFAALVSNQFPTDDPKTTYIGNTLKFVNIVIKQVSSGKANFACSMPACS